jgi:hypothetical protein
MSTITIDASLKQVFLELTEVAQIVDGDGHVLGIFKPRCQLDAELQAIAAKVFHPEELNRVKREQTGQGISFAEVKKRLQALENQA